MDHGRFIGPLVTRAVSVTMHGDLDGFYNSAIFIQRLARHFLGVGFGFIEHRRRQKLETTLLSQLSSAINRVRVIIPYRSSLQERLDKFDPDEIKRWSWIVYKSLSDIYVILVSHYLANQKSFNYEDLKQMVKSQIIKTGWEEKIWRDLIALRPENRRCEIPAPFIKKAKNKEPVNKGATRMP